MNKLAKTNKINKRSSCLSCRKEFSCSPSGKCWCSEVFIPPDKLSEIKEKYDSCLCPECLDSYSK